MNGQIDLVEVEHQLAHGIDACRTGDFRERRYLDRRPAVPPSRRMGGKGGRFLKGLGRSRSDFGAFFSKN